MDQPVNPVGATVAFDVVITLEDHLTFDRHLVRRPAARRRLGRWAFGGCVAAPIVAFMIVLIARFALAGSTCDLDEALDPSARLRVFLQATAGVAIVEALVGGALVARRRQVAKSTIRAQRRSRPGVDPSDPTLSEPCRYACDGVGFRAEVPSSSFAGVWALVASFEETVDYIFLVLGPHRGFIVPKRDLWPATVLAVRDLLGAHVRRA